MRDAIMRSSFGGALSALDAWIDGPATLVNERWHALRPGDRVVARIAEDGSSVMLAPQGRGSASPSFVPLDPGQEAQARAALATTVAGRDLTIVVPRHWVIERHAELPLEAASHLEGIVAARVSSLSPIAPHETLFGHRVTTVDRASKKLLVGIVILPRSRIARTLEVMETVKWRELAVEAPFGENDRITLYPRRSGVAVSHRRVKRLTTMLLAASVASMLAVFVAGPFVDAYYEGRRAEFDARAATARAAIVAAAQPDKAATLPEQAALDLKNDSISALGALDDLATALPSHSFATEISLVEGRIRLTGRTTDLPDVLTQLESSGRFLDSKLVGTAQRAADGYSSDFELETRPLIRTGGALR